MNQKLWKNFNRFSAWLLTTAMLTASVPSSVIAMESEVVPSVQQEELQPDITENAQEEEFLSEEVMVEEPSTEEPAGDNIDNTGTNITLAGQAILDDSYFGDSGEKKIEAETPEQITEQNQTAQAVIEVAWEDEGNLSGRRGDGQAETDRLEIYANQERMDPQPSITDKTEVPTEDTSVLRYAYTIQDLPLTDKTGTLIQYTVKQINLPAGYEAQILTDEEPDSDTMSEEDALFAEDTQDAEAITLHYSDTEQKFKSADGTYFQNTLPEYTVSGTIHWDRTGTETAVPSMEQWFAEQFKILRNEADYSAYKTQYQASEDEADTWKFSVAGLFTTNEDGTPATYQIVTENADACQVVTEPVTISSDKIDVEIRCQAVVPETETPVVEEEAAEEEIAEDPITEETESEEPIEEEVFEEPAEEVIEAEPEEMIEEDTSEPQLAAEITEMTAEALAAYMEQKEAEDPDWIQKLTAEELTALMTTAVQTQAFDLILDKWGEEKYDALMEAIEARAEALDVVEEIAGVYREEAVLLGGEENLTLAEDENQAVLIKTVIPVTLNQETTLIYTVTTTEGTAYIGKYVVIGQDGTQGGEELETKDGKITVAVKEASTYTIKLVDAEEDKTYTVTADGSNKNLTKACLMSNAKQEGISKDKSADYYYSEYTDNPVVLTKTWNDGRIEHDEDFQNHFKEKHVKLVCKAGDTDITDTLSGLKENDLNISVDAAAADNKMTVTGSVYTISFEKLPKYYYNAEGTKEEIKYSFKEINCTDGNCPIQMNNYIVSDRTSAGTEDTTGTCKMNTLKVNTDEANLDYSATIVWKDKEKETDSAHTSRPTLENYVSSGNITLKRYVNGGTEEQVPFEGDQVTVSQKKDGNTVINDQWNLTIADLPKYDANGNEYIYYVEQNTDFASSGDTEDKYKYTGTYENVGAYGVKLDGLYNGGTLTDTRVETIQFKFKVDWIDGDEEWYRDCNLYLYRYADADGSDVGSASPVQGFDTMSFKDGKLYIGDQEVTQDEEGYYIWSGSGTDNNKLDKYAPSGALYTYFIKQKDLGNADYVDSYYDKDATEAHGDDAKYITNEGTIVNQLTKTESPQITKTWEAKALQGKIGELYVKLKLQKRYVYQSTQNAGKQYTAWEDVVKDGETVTTTQGGFSSAVMTKEVGEGTYEGYTSDELENQKLVHSDSTDETTVTLPAGTKIEYQWVETAVVHKTSAESTGTETTFTDGQAKLSDLTSDSTDVVVKQTYTTSDDGVYTEVKNQLIDRTQVNVTKDWSGDDWPENAVVNVKLCREDGQVKDKDGKLVDAIDNDGNAVHSITLSKGNQKASFENLPRYDSEGREIIYYVQEKENEIYGNDTVYHYYDTSYLKKTEEITLENNEELNIRQTDAKIINTRPGPGGVTINVNKRWLDDGDLTHRENVVVGIFSKAAIEDGTAFYNNGTLDSGKAETTTTLTDGSAWTQKLTFVPKSSQNVYWKIIGNYDSAKTTEVTDYPIYNDEGMHVTENGNKLYWKVDAVEETSTETTEYPVYVQKTTTLCPTTNDNTSQVVTWENEKLYWKNESEQITTTETEETTNNPVYPNTYSNTLTGKLVYLDNITKKETINDKDANGSPNTPVYVRETSSFNQSDYIALEISVNGTAVIYKKQVVDGNAEESYAWVTESAALADGNSNSFTSGSNDSKVIGEVGTTDHLYNVYLGTTSANGMSGYVIYNQRKGVQEIDVTKEWINGNLTPEEQPKAAFFKIYRKINGTDGDAVDVTDQIGNGIGELVTDDDTKPSKAAIYDIGTIDSPNKAIKVPNKASTAGSTDTVMQAIVKNLPKYDKLGRLYQYSIEEVAVEDPNPNGGTPIIRTVSGGTVKVSVKQGDKYKYDLGTDNPNIQYYDQYSCNTALTNQVTGNQNTNDVFTYASTNTRSQTFKVSLRKVWQDDGIYNQDEVVFRRADIYFQMFKVPVGSTFNVGEAEITINSESHLQNLSAEQVEALINSDVSTKEGGDYKWDTKQNEWYWTCDMDGEFQRYNNEGKEYLYFAVERSQNFEDYKQIYYNGEVQPNKVVGSGDDARAPENTEEVFNQTDYNTANLLVVHKEGAGLQSNGSVLNVRQGKFNAKATKIWADLPANFNKSKTPVIYMELRRRLILEEENHIYGAWETVSVVKNDNGSTSYQFPETDRFDKYGRKYEYDVQERYYETADKIDIATKLELNDKSQFFKCAKEDTNTFTLIGEGYYIKGEDNNYHVPTNTDSFDSDTAFYTKKVTYTQSDEGEYVKTGENEYKLYSDLSEDDQKLVQKSQRYNKTEGEYIQLTDKTYLGLEYVPGYQKAAQAEGDKFTWTNSYDPNASIRQRVEITVNKTWELPAYASEVPQLEFQLWRKIEGDDESEEKISTIVQAKSSDLTSVNDNNGTTIKKEKVLSVTFTKDQKNSGQPLAYFAPNGQPYQYYVKEIVPGGYLGSVAGAEKNTTVTVQGDGKADTVLATQGVTFPYYKAGTDQIVTFYNQKDDAKDNEKDTTTSYTNTYNGVPVVTNKAIKVWDDQNNAYGTRPTDINLTLKQSGGGNTNDREVAYSFTDTGHEAGVNGAWSDNKDTTDQWTFNFTNGYINSESFLADATDENGNKIFTTDGQANDKFPMYGPNGEKYTYTVVETGITSDIDNKLGSYTATTTRSESNGVITNTITNTLPTTSITAKKIWQGTDGTSFEDKTGESAEERANRLAEFNKEHTWIYGTDNTHTDAELENLYHMGAMPTKITFKLQYTDDDNPTDNSWKDVPDATEAENQKFTKVFALASYDSNGKIVWDKFEVVKALREENNEDLIFKNLPKYATGYNSSTENPKYRKYRILETAEYADNSSNGKFTYQSVTTAIDGGTTAVTNQITLKKINLIKEWDDQENFLNTRPDDIKFVVTNANGSETYELTKANNSIANNQDQWSKEIWTPAVSITVTEPYDSQSDATKSMLKDVNGQKIYNVNNNEPIITTSTDGQTITVKNVLDENLKKRTQITVSKTWVDDEYTSLYSVIRPTEIEYKLQYSYLKNGKWSDWADADDKCGIISSNEAQDSAGSTESDTSASVSETTNTKKSVYVEAPTNGENNWPDVTWNELYQYYNDPSTDDALPIRYQVVETTVNGYTTTYSAPVTAKDAAKVEDTLYDTKGTLTVTNTVDDSACASLKKAWGTTMENNIAIATALSTTVTGKKDGENILAAIGSAADVETLQSKGLLPMGIKFQLQYTTKTNPGNSDWTDYSGKVYTADTAAKIYDLLSKDVTVYNKLPKTDTNGNAIQYRFVEAAVNFKDTDNNHYISVVSSVTSSTTTATTENTTLYTVDTGLTSSDDADKKTVAYASVITNKIPTGKITVTKSVMDEGNRDNTRGHITVELQRTYSTYATGTLTYDTTTKKWNPITFDVPIYDTKTFTNKTDGPSNEWRIVEKTVNGTDLNGYTATLTYTSASSVKLKDATDKTTDTVNIDNTRVPARFSLTAEKNWADDDNNSMDTRPADSKVNFTLQYSTNQGATWNTVKESASGESAPNSTTSTDNKEAYYYKVQAGDSHSGYYYTKSGNNWTTENGTEAYTTSSPTQTVNGLSGELAETATWENLCVNSTGNPIYYRVIENNDAAVTGYKVVTANDITIENGTLQTVDGKVGVFTATANATADMKITNHLDTTSLKVTKTWAGDDTYKAQMRPDLITYKVEYCVNKDGSTWKPVPKNMLQLISADQDKASIAEQKEGKDTGEFTMNVGKKNASQAITLEGLPIKDNAGNQYLYRVSEVSMTYKGTTADTDKTVALNNGSTWTSSNTKSDFVSKTNEVSSTTIGAYTVTKGETDWTAGTGGAAGTWKAEITNRLETVEVTATKNWDDEANRDHLRAAVTFHLKPQTRSGENYTDSTDFIVAEETTGQTIALDAASLDVKWKNLPRYQKFAADHSESALYYYKVSEDDTIKDSSNKKSIYSIAVSPEQVAYAASNNGDKLAVGVTNSYTPERFTATAKKTWNDYNDAMNTRPAEVSLTLQYKVGDSGTWKDVVKAATETAMPTTAGTNPIYCGGKYYKVESGKYVPDGITAYTTSEVTQKVKGNSTDNSLSDTATWNDLSVKSDGTQITYRVVENETSANGNSVKVTGYLDPVIVGTTNADGTTSDTFKGKNNTQTDVTVTNNIDTVPLNLTKTWAGDKSDNGDFRSMRPDSLIYQVEYALKPDKESDTVTWKNLPDAILAIADDTTATNVEVLQADADGTNTGRFKVTIDKTESADAIDAISLIGLPYQNSAGKQYIYRVSEIEAVFKVNSSDGTDTTDTTIQADLAKSSGTSNVIWASLADTTSKLDIGNSNTYTIGGYKITVAETSYVAASSGQTGNGSWNAAFTNTLETVSLEATKNWLDNNNRDNTRVDLEFGVTVKLGEETCTQFTVPSKELKTTDNTYTVTWTGLPKYDRTTAKWTDTDVKKYSYEVKESNTSDATDAQKEMLKKYTPSGGTTTYDATNNKWITEITNTLGSIDVFEIEASKVWDDEFTADTGETKHNAWCNENKLKRPDSVKFKLQYMIKAADGSISWTDVVPSADKSSETSFPSTKDESGLEVIFWSGRYFVWVADQTDLTGNTGKYVEADGVYTTSSKEQEINEVTGDTWSGANWENLPVSAKGEVISYRVAESSNNVPTYYFSKRKHEEIKGTDSFVTTTDGKKKATTKITNKLTKLKLFKTDGIKLENGNLKPLEGVEFQIQLKGNDGAGTGTVYTATTNSSGEVEFVGLAPGTYIVTELKTTQGHQLLSAPFEVELPLSMTQEDIYAWNNGKGDSQKVNLDNAVKSDDGKSWNFYQLTYTVTNTANFDLPMTGSAGGWNPGYLGLLPFLGLWLLYRRKRRQDRLEEEQA